MKDRIPNGLGESEAAHDLAITEINKWLVDNRVADIVFTRGDFNITLEARSIPTGKQHTPVEWVSEEARYIPGHYR